MGLFEFLREKIAKDTGFIACTNLEIVDMSVGHVQAEVKIQDSMLNPGKSVHGGFLFTLCDTVGGLAAMTHGVSVTTSMASISYLSPGYGDKLMIEAVEVKAGKTIFHYDVLIYNADGNLVCKANMEYYKIGILNECGESDGKN